MSTQGGTRDRILDAAAAVMGEWGLGHATTKEIARAAGLSEAGLYKHFAGKAELFVRVLAERMPHFGPLVAELSREPEQGSVAGNLRRIAAAARDFYDRSFPMAAALFAEPALLEDHKAALKRDGTGPQHTSAAVARYLRIEQRHGRVRAGADTESAATLLVGGALSIAFVGHFTEPHPDPASRDEAARALVDTLLPALLPD